MKCPSCQKKEFMEVSVDGAMLDFCTHCLGLWFEEGELRKATDETADLYRWMDTDIWQDQGMFKAGESERICPIDQIAMRHVHYGDSSITIDACKQCGGVWLDRGEFQRIAAYTRREGSQEIWGRYYEVLKKQAEEIFTGPDSLREEVEDLLMVVKFFKYRFIAKHPMLTQWLRSLQVVK
jgi:uncharacterized protein